MLENGLVRTMQLQRPIEIRSTFLLENMNKRRRDLPKMAHRITLLT